MAELTTKTRPTGATAVLARHGFPQVTSATGGEIQIFTGPSQAGFNPIDLLYASLSACMAMSARIAASQMGVLDKLTDIRAEVTGEKSTEGLSRVVKFNILLTIRGDSIQRCGMQLRWLPKRKSARSAIRFVAARIFR
jgi:uncharacterized OsmC-like protein